MVSPGFELALMYLFLQRPPPPPPPPVTIFLLALKSKGGAKIRNCQCEILYKM